MAAGRGLACGRLQGDSLKSTLWYAYTHMYKHTYMHICSVHLLVCHASRPPVVTLRADPLNVIFKIAHNVCMHIACMYAHYCVLF